MFVFPEIHQRQQKNRNAAKTNSFRVSTSATQGAHGQDFGQKPGKAYWCVCDACFFEGEGFNSPEICPEPIGSGQRETLADISRNIVVKIHLCVTNIFFLV